MVAQGALLNIRVMVELDVAAGASWKGVTICGGYCCEWQPLGGVDVVGKAAGKGLRW